MNLKYDIIGDIHGQADKLIELLELLGYKKSNGIFQHPYRKVVFLGDFIDRGPKQKGVIEIVRPMIEQGHAMAVMGNHEFNAICYHTNHPKTGKPLRAHSEKNRRQHRHFLNEYPLGDPETISVINWFKTLPLFLELENFRVIHACWDQKMIDQITPKLKKGNLLTDIQFIEASQEGSFFYEAMELLLKGPEIPLPEGVSFFDKDGNERRIIRIKWWEKELKSYQQGAVVPIEERSKVPDIPISTLSQLTGYPETAPPVFFGHYWFTGAVKPVSHNIACLDYSAGKDGELVAYCWDNSDMRAKKRLHPDQFVSVGAFQ